MEEIAAFAKEVSDTAECTERDRTEYKETPSLDNLNKLSDALTYNRVVLLNWRERVIAALNAEIAVVNREIATVALMRAAPQVPKAAPQLAPQVPLSQARVVFVYGGSVGNGCAPGCSCGRGRR